MRRFKLRTKIYIGVGGALAITAATVIPVVLTQVVFKDASPASSTVEEPAVDVFYGTPLENLPAPATKSGYDGPYLETAATTYTPSSPVGTTKLKVVWKYVSADGNKGTVYAEQPVTVVSDDALKNFVAQLNGITATSKTEGEFNALVKSGPYDPSADSSAFGFSLPALPSGVSATISKSASSTVVFFAISRNGRTVSARSTIVSFAPVPTFVRKPITPKKKLLVIGMGQSNAEGGVPAQNVTAQQEKRYDVPVVTRIPHLGLDRATKKWVPIQKKNNLNQNPGSYDVTTYNASVAFSAMVADDASLGYEDVRYFGLATSGAGFGYAFASNKGIDSWADLQLPYLKATLDLISNPADATHYINLADYDIHIWWQQGEADRADFKQFPDYQKYYVAGVLNYLQSAKDVIGRDDVTITISSLTPTFVNQPADAVADYAKAGAGVAAVGAADFPYLAYVDGSAIDNSVQENGPGHWGLTAMRAIALAHKAKFIEASSKVSGADTKTPVGEAKLFRQVYRTSDTIAPTATSTSEDQLDGSVVTGTQTHTLYKGTDPDDDLYSAMGEMYKHVSHTAASGDYYKFRAVFTLRPEQTSGNEYAVSVVWRQKLNPVFTKADLDPSIVGAELLSVTDPTGEFTTATLPFGGLRFGGTVAGHSTYWTLDDHVPWLWRIGAAYVAGDGGNGDGQYVIAKGGTFSAASMPPRLKAVDLFVIKDNY